MPSLLNGTIDAPAVNRDQLLRTRRRILDYAHDTPLIYLTTHDIDTEKRLLNKEVIR